MCVLILVYMCPHTSIYVSSSYCTYVSGLRPKAEAYVSSYYSIYESSYYYIYVSSYYYIYVSSYYYIYVSSYYYYYICVLIRQRTAAEGGG